LILWLRLSCAATAVAVDFPFRLQPIFQFGARREAALLSDLICTALNALPPIRRRGLRIGRGIGVASMQGRVNDFWDLRFRHAFIRLLRPVHFWIDCDDVVR
jgi:hypothetical protein